MKKMLDGMSDLLFKSIAKSTDAYLYVMKVDEDITRWSKNAPDTFDLPGEYAHDLIKIWGALIHPDDYHLFAEDINKIWSGEKDYHHCEYRIRKKNGEYVWVRCRGQVTRTEDGSISWFIGLVREIARLTKVDYITNLLSIYEFRGNLDTAISAGVREGGILLLGVDNFKKINTMYSYSFGNQVLLKLAEILQNVCPPHVNLYRIEGDKFAFVCLHYSQREIVQLFRETQEQMQKLELVDGETVRLSASAGALMLNGRYAGVDEIHKDLEHALSISKQNVPGTLTFFSEELLEESLRELRLREELRRCVENGCECFELYFQPIMEGEREGELHSCEALLRWNNDRFPNTYPDKFIPILEETGLIIPVGKWVGLTAIRHLREWRKEQPNLKVNINVSYVQIMEGGLEEYIKQSMQELGMPMDSVVIEITESCDVKDVESTVAFVNAVRSMGMEVALDDFGTGYSSISILQHIPTDWIKLDHNFVSKIKDNQFDRNIVQYLVSLCHSLGYRVCAEGVEDEFCRGMVQAQKVEALQGYHFSRPIPAGEFYKRYVAGGKCRRQ